MGRKSKLTNEAIEEMRSSSEPQKVLAAKHNVTQQYVSAIRRDPSRGVTALMRGNSKHPQRGALWKVNWDTIVVK